MTYHKSTSSTTTVDLDSISSTSETDSSFKSALTSQPITSREESTSTELTFETSSLVDQRDTKPSMDSGRATTISSRTQGCEISSHTMIVYTIVFFIAVVVVLMVIFIISKFKLAEDENDKGS